MLEIVDAIVLVLHLAALPSWQSRHCKEAGGEARPLQDFVIRENHARGGYDVYRSTPLVIRGLQKCDDGSIYIGKQHIPASK